MSRNPENPSPMQELIATLDIEKIEENLFRGISPQVGWQRVFGGQVVAQALVAAQRTVDAERPVHSLHAYFMRPGDPAVPILYQVERIRDGASFSTRRVVAVQHGKAIFALSSSFQIIEGGYDHQIVKPTVPMPEELMGEAQFKELFLAEAPEPVKRYWKRNRPIEVRPTSLVHYLTKEKLSRARMSGCGRSGMCRTIRRFAQPCLPIFRT